MKTRFLLLAAAVGLIASCSPDDNSDNNNPETAFFPLTSGSYWTYNIPGGGTSLAVKDSLYTANDTVINTIAYKKFKTKDQPAFGFYSNSLNGNSVRKDGDKIVVTGKASLNFGTGLPLNIDVTDFTAFQESAAENAQLSVLNGTMTQTIPGFEAYPMTITYSLKAIAGISMPTFTAPDGTTYTDVKTVKTVLNAKITTIVAPLTFPVPIMNSQDVVVSTQYYAKNIGMVYANTTLSYNLQDFSSLGLQLPIPQSGSQTQQEILDTYPIGN